MSKSDENQRTYALIGTGGSGKTSLAEMILFQTGIINRLGASEEGTTCLDYEPEEIRRSGSIQPGFATYLFEKNRHYLVDIPGDGNFTGDLSLLLKGVDSVIFVIDAVDGVRPLTKKLWSMTKAENIPIIVFINKLDRDRADFQMAYNSLTSILGLKTIPLYIPIVQSETFMGIINVFNEKGLMFGENGAVLEAPIPTGLLDDVTLLRDIAIENIAESDEELMEKYLEEGSLSKSELEIGLRKGVLSGELIPVVVGSALENKGGLQLLKVIQSLFPSPSEHSAITDCEGKTRKCSCDEPATCFVFKTLADPFAGQLNILKVISGTISSETTLINARTGEPERLGNLLYLNGKNHIVCKDVLGPGSIIAASKLKNTLTGDTLFDEKSPFKITPPLLPPQLITYALSPKEKGDEDKVYAAIHKLLDEDVTLKLSRDTESSDILLSGMGQLHIELAVEKAKRRYKTEIILKTPKVPYRETVRGKIQVQGRHRKQSGGRGQFGDCWIEMEGLPRGSGYVFEDAVVGGSIPRQYIPAIDKGIQESAARGFLAGCQVVDFKIKVYDGTYHNVDSSEMAFKIAGSLAFKKAMDSLKTVLLEPIMLMCVSIPDEHMGDVIGDLSSRRGKVLGSDSQSGITEIKVHVPMNEVLRYAPDLRSMTGGQGVFTMEFACYEEAPIQIVERVIAEYEKQKNKD